MIGGFSLPPAPAPAPPPVPPRAQAAVPSQKIILAAVRQAATRALVAALIF